MRYLLFFLILTISGVSAQVVNSNGSIVWNPSSYDSKVGYTFYSKGLMSGIMESAELIIENRSSYELFIKVSYTIYDNCGESKSYTKSETLKAGTTSSSSGAFFSGIDFESNCKDISSYSDNLKSKIKNVTVRLISLENNTEKEQELQRKKQEEEIRKQREKQEELAKKKLEEERKKETELKKKNEEENNRKTDEAALKRKLEEEASAKKAFEEKEAKAKSLTDETERKEALNKIALEKKEIEKKTTEKNAAKKKAEAESKLPKLTDKEKNEIALMTAKQKEMERRAKALETEGDNLNRLGSVFMDAALQKYKQAQETFYSFTVQQKIDKIEASKEVAKLVNNGLENLEYVADDIRNALDQSGIPISTGTRFSYEGFSPGFTGYGTAKTIKPMSASITHGFYRLFALEAGFTYLQSPVYRFGLYDNNKSHTGQYVEGSYTAAGPEVSAGLAYPNKHFDIYVLYGFYFPFTLSGTPHTKGYTFEYFKDNFGIVPVITKIKFGAHIKIPKTRLGIGVQYIITSVKEEKLLAGGPGDTIDESNGFKYSLGPGNEHNIDKLKYNSFGVSIYYRSNR